MLCGVKTLFGDFGFDFSAAFFSVKGLDEDMPRAPIS
jgi:hypothetical protein